MDEPGFDVVVVGGGPCGSTVSTLIAREGHRVLLLERERFPRYQIGESLLPATVHGICRLLGVSEKVEAAGFTVKRGGTFRWGASPEPWTFAFAASPRFAGPHSTALQVERMRFDQILLDNARATGVDVREEATVTSLLREGDRVSGVTWHDSEGVKHQTAARFVVDASGNGSRIHTATGGTRRYSEFFRNLALFGYFRGGKRLPPPNRGNIIAAAFPSGWFWYIPLNDELTSVGAVLLPEALERVRGDRAEVLQTLIGECPFIADLLDGVPRVTTGPYGQVRVRKDYSYIQDAFTAPGLVLAGDAACFIDPVFSSGVHLATYSGLLAARSINTVLTGALTETACMEEYEARYRQEYARFHDFLVAFYDMHQDQHSYFWRAKKVTDHTGTELESFAELVGGGSSGETALTARTTAIQELSQAVQTIDGDTKQVAPDRDLLHTSLARSVTRTGIRLQLQATGDTDDTTPIRPHGLIPTTDGTHWTTPPDQAA
ncbi:tryptophan 7-halogenase [Actinomadura sp. NEAU-AAG7]|uniref:tryptophan 7-halogenase n=1 Tax=Actinomadura sp. NEAU-AAG7 TaxID=2839640 RepID=UPI001BE47764|nr:tryptophan 7-halogenase [Actinomadura sp. NEAU-AAG7]MBT2210202.1 tryptophan 7-halogenase [Actinomadura sp. NEAU-AAG7]